MMDQDDLKHHLDCVLSRESQMLRIGLATAISVKEGKETKLQYDHAETLIGLFASIQNDEDLKQSFVTFLCEKMVLTNDYSASIINTKGVYQRINWGIQGLAFYTLTMLGFSREALDSLKGNSHCPTTLGNVLNLMIESRLELLDPAELGELRAYLSGFQDNPDFDSSIIVKLLDKQYKFTKKIVAGVDIEINRDKDKLIRKMTYLGFDGNYSSLLTGIDRYINTETTDILNAGMIGNLRNFMEDAVVDISKKILAVEGQDLPVFENTTSLIGRSRKHLKQKLELSDDEHKLINTFIKILHNEGGHSFMSKKEYFRLARNIAVEITLLLLSKFESKYN